MKRSEMVDLLYDKLLELYMVDFSTEERVKFLLKAIEEAGMLPPKTDFKAADGIVYKVSMWEPEDE